MYLNDWKEVETLEINLQVNQFVDGQQFLYQF